MTWTSSVVVMQTYWRYWQSAPYKTQKHNFKIWGMYTFWLNILTISVFVVVSWELLKLQKCYNQGPLYNHFHKYFLTYKCDTSTTKPLTNFIYKKLMNSQFKYWPIENNVIDVKCLKQTIVWMWIIIHE